MRFCSSNGALNGMSKNETVENNYSFSCIMGNSSEELAKLENEIRNDLDLLETDIDFTLK